LPEHTNSTLYGEDGEDGEDGEAGEDEDGGMRPSSQG
jgi:hypothetical protein